MEPNCPIIENPQDTLQSTASTLAEHEPKKRGRKPGSKNKPKDEIDLQTNSANVEANLALVRKTANAILTTLDSVVTGNIARKAARLGAPENFQKDIAANVSMSTDEREIASECSATIIARHQLLLKYAPEVMLACVFVSYGSRIMMINARLEQIALRIKMQRVKPSEPIPQQQ